MQIREDLYKKGTLTSWRPPVYCISVGNLRIGGTGKTPVCEWLLKWSMQKGKNPALLSRGYKGDKKNCPCLVTPDSSASTVGDEALMLARSCPGTSVVVDPQRSRAGRWILDKAGSDLLVLDDGFQHISVQRDLDLVLLTPDDLIHQWNRVLPSGLWREGETSLHRASALLLDATNADLEKLQPWIYRRLKPWDKPVFVFSRRFNSFTRSMDGEVFYKPFFDKYLLVSAVGNPAKLFYNATEACGKEPVEHLLYPDHYPYIRTDFEIIKQKALQKGAEVILCTNKDGVKLKDCCDHTVLELNTEIDFDCSFFTELDFENWLMGNGNKK